MIVVVPSHVPTCHSFWTVFADSIGVHAQSKYISPSNVSFCLQPKSATERYLNEEPSPEPAVIEEEEEELEEAQSGAIVPEAFERLPAESLSNHVQEPIRSPRARLPIPPDETSIRSTPRQPSFERPRHTTSIMRTGVSMQPSQDSYQLPYNDYAQSSQQNAFNGSSVLQRTRLPMPPDVTREGGGFVSKHNVYKDLPPALNDPETAIISTMDGESVFQVRVS